MKINQLTFTRFLAAISIVVMHFGMKSIPFTSDYIDFIFQRADIFVSYFFVLSGFVMMIAYQNKKEISTQEYYINRFARIYPIYFLGVFLVFLQQLKTLSFDFFGLFLNIVMLQSWVPTKALSCSPPNWSLSVEFLFYAVFPFVFNTIFKKCSIKKVTLFIVVFWIISQVIFEVLLHHVTNGGASYNLIKFNPIMHLNEFLLGNLTGFYFVKHLSAKKYYLDWHILFVFSLLILILKFPLGFNYHNGLLAVLFVPLIVLISLNNGFITKLFNKKIFIFLGEISFGIYILQFPVYSIISSYSLNKYFHIQDATIVFFIRLVILIFISAISYIYIEKPIQAKIKNYYSLRLKKNI